MKKPNLSVWGMVFCLTLATLLLNKQVYAQIAGTTNFYTNIKAYNLASLWHADQLKLLSLKEMEPFPEPYGTLGKNYQRFYIHYTVITKDASDPYRYQVQGKTRVGNQVRPFTGTITIKQAGIFKPGSVYAPDTYKGCRRRRLICQVNLNEANSITGSGTITGELTTNFCINAQNQLLYDTLDFGIDGYGNNMFIGVWTAHGNKTGEKLQFGDFNHPDPKFGDVDGITVPPEYEKYGWQSFVNAQKTDLHPASKAAIAEEKRQWWK